jgi:hypothetical protein
MFSFLVAIGLSIVAAIPQTLSPVLFLKRIVFSNTLPFNAVQPSGIRQIQAALGCTFQSPLEAVSIINITDANDAALPYDPTAASLVSNGSIVCLNLTAIHRVLSPIQQLHVTFSITNPSEWLLSMNDTQIMDLVAASPSMNLLGTTGSRSIGTPISGAAVSSDLSKIGIFVGGCMGLAAVAIAVSLLIFYRQYTRATVVCRNPIAVTREWDTIHEDNRVKFGDEMIRNHVHV